MWFCNVCIQVLPDGVFAGMDSLFRILIQYNFITELTNGTFTGVNPFGIALNNNRITRIGCSTFQNVSRLALIGLQHNRLEEISCQFEHQVKHQLLPHAAPCHPCPTGSARYRCIIWGFCVD